MAEQQMVEWLSGKLDRLEQLARAATPGPWKAQNRRHSGAGWVVLGGAHPLPGMATDSRVVHRDGGYPQDWPAESVNAAADAGLIAVVADPAAVLRRVAAERQVLAEHQPEPGDAYENVCRSCRMPEPGWNDGVPAPWPCRTVRLLAEAYGWTEDGS